MDITHAEVLLRIGLATLVGIIFGIERKHKQKPVGSRTHVLVSVAACGIAIMSAYGFINADPARLVVGVLTGIGFLGAGVIWKSPTGGVQGITTAAELFLIACIGIGYGLGVYFVSTVLTCVGFATMTAGQFKRWLFRHKTPATGKDEQNEPFEISA